MGIVTCLLSSLSTAVFPTDIIRRMGTSFECSDSFNHLGGQQLVMIVQWYSRQPFTNQNERLSSQTIPKNLCAESLYPFPWPYSFCTYLRREKNLFSVRDKKAASSSYNKTWYRDKFM